MFCCNSEDKKCIVQNSFVMGGVVLLVFMLTIFVAIKAVVEVRSMSRPGAQVNTISVSGEGKVTAIPDIGQVTLSVVEPGKEAAEAQQAAARSINEIIEFLKDSGVAEKDIKTSEYSIYPIYDYPDGRREASGYEVRQSMTIKIRELDNSGVLVAGAAERGANQIGGISFTTEDPTLLREEARRKAIEDAKMKAKVLARDLDVRLGDVVSFNESGGGYPIFYGKAMMSGIGGGEDMMAPEMPVGENDVIVNVTINFEIR